MLLSDRQHPAGSLPLFPRSKPRRDAGKDAGVPCSYRTVSLSRHSPKSDGGHPAGSLPLFPVPNLDAMPARMPAFHGLLGPPASLLAVFLFSPVPNLDAMPARMPAIRADPDRPLPVPSFSDGSSVLYHLLTVHCFSCHGLADGILQNPYAIRLV